MTRFIEQITLAVALIATATSSAIANTNDDQITRQLLQNCVGCKLPHDLHGRDLHGVRFTGADMNGTDLSGANLRDAQFTGVDMTDAKFDRADLTNARFTGVNLKRTSFGGARLDNVELTGTHIDSDSLRGVDVHAFLHHCIGCDLESAQLPHADIRDARLEGVNFAQADLRNAQVRGATLFGANFRDAHLDGIDFAGSRLCTHNYDGRIVCPRLTGATTSGTHFDGALLCSNHDDDCSAMTAADVVRYAAQRNDAQHSTTIE